MLEPSFKRPDEIFAMAAEERAARVKEDDDLCLLRGRTDEEAARFFVRCVLPVEVIDDEEGTHWGLWVEVSSRDFHRIVELWRDPGQASEPPMHARLANSVIGYPETQGLPVALRLTSPTQRAALSLPEDSIHPFALECRAGVTVERVRRWLARLG